MTESPEINLKSGTDLSLDQLIALYGSVGWTAYTTEPMVSQLLQAIQNSTYTVAAWYGDCLVGLARGLSDDVSVFYLQDILVHPKYQRKGIGTALIQDCLKRFEHVRMKVLLTDDHPEQSQFYESMGFRNIKKWTAVKLNTFVKFRGLE